MLHKRSNARNRALESFLQFRKFLLASHTMMAQARQNTTRPQLAHTLLTPAATVGKAPPLIRFSSAAKSSPCACSETLAVS